MLYFVQAPCCDNSKMARNEPQVNLRMPEALKEGLDAAAEANKRSLTAEIISRLDASFSAPGKSDAGWASLQGRAEQAEALSESLRSTADMADTLRTLAAQISTSVLSRLPEDAITESDRDMYETMGRWLSTSDRRGAAFAAVKLLEAATPQTLEALQNFASHLEDLGLYRKPITLLKSDAKAKQAPKRPGSVNKVILVGNLGRDPEVKYLPVVKGSNLTAPKPNKGPARSPNARKPLPKK
ncbi:MAG: Arc family DNA-binding protein [Pseudomonadota bacterium]